MDYGIAGPVTIFPFSARAFLCGHAARLSAHGSHKVARRYGLKRAFLGVLFARRMNGPDLMMPFAGEIGGSAAKRELPDPIVTNGLDL